MSNCLTQLSRLTPRARLHVKARDETSETTVRQAQTVTGTAAGEGKVIATTYWSDPTTTLHVGDACEVLAAMPDGSADCIVTSPPYWAKRDYGDRRSVRPRSPTPPPTRKPCSACSAQARRVLADDGTCWLNLGDSYSAGGAAATGLHAYISPGLASRRAPRMPGKNLLGIPWRVAFALQDDGWILCNAIVWHKPNAMPESGRDRLNCRHELIFLLVKQPHYWFDLDPIRVPHATVRPSCGRPTGPAGSRTRQPPRAPTGGTHPGGDRPGGNRPLKYGRHSREIIAAQRYGNSRHRRGHPRGRNAIVRYKPNAMPESVRDRLNCRHELIFLLVKQSAYWFDPDPIRVPHTTVHPVARGGTRWPPRGPAGGRHPRRNRPPKYGPHSREVVAARRYGDGRHRRGHPRRPQPRRRVVHPHPPVPRAALRRVPHRHPAALHCRRMQARRHRAGPVLRHRHHRNCRAATRPAGSPASS